MILFLKLIAAAFVVSLLVASILVPWLARRFRQHDAWVKQAQPVRRRRAF
jgi:multidrug efflux pump subunit AcrB